MKADINENSDIPTKPEPYWRQHYEAWRTSGLLKTAYCREHQLNYAGFMYWQKRFKENNDVSLIPVRLRVPSISNDKILCTLTLANGCLLKIYEREALEIILEKL